VEIKNNFININYKNSNKTLLILGFICLMIFPNYSYAGESLDNLVDGIMKSNFLLNLIYSIPDIDLIFSKLPIIGHNGLNLFHHRSIITHSPLPAILIGTFFINFFKKYKLTFIGQIFAFLFSTILAIHFIADMFPNAWNGFAYIRIPFIGTFPFFPATFSFLWLAFSAYYGYSFIFEKEEKKEIVEDENLEVETK